MARQLKASLSIFCDGGRVCVEPQSSPFQGVHFVASQRLDSEISTMGIIPPSLC